MNENWRNLLPSDTEDVCEKYLDLYFQTMFERQQIWYNRFIDKSVNSLWTQDKIFQKYKFTNVYRELDRCSQWLIHNVITKECKLEDLIFKIMLYRIYNKPETFQKVEIPNYKNYDKTKFLNDIIWLNDIQGINPLNNKAYLINTFFKKGASHEVYTEYIVPSIHKVVKKIIPYFDKECSLDVNSLMKILMSVEGIGKFVSHEWFIDFCYINIYSEQHEFCFNQNHYTNVGPGAEGGLRLVFPSLKRNKKQGIYVLTEISEQKLKEFGQFKYLYWNKHKKEYVIKNKCNITLHQNEMWLCEFFKYWKMTIGSGKQRSEFVAKTKTLKQSY